MKVQIRTTTYNPASYLWLLCWIRNVLFLIAIVTLGYYGYVSADAWIYQAYHNRQFEQTVTRSTSGSLISEAPKQEVAAGATSAEVDRPNAVSFGAAGRPGSVLGRIEIKKTGLAVLILEGTDNRSLQRGVGHIQYTALPGQPGNAAIAGHRDSFFRDLRKLSRNDEITVTTSAGPFYYVVDYLEVVDPTDTAVLDSSSDPVLTLVTCYPFSYVGPAPKRLIVRAHLVP
jgi:sortase A